MNYFKTYLTQLLTLGLLLILLNSCASKKILIDRPSGKMVSQIKYLTNSNYLKLNGTYENRKDSSGYRLWKDLFLKQKRFKRQNELEDNQYDAVVKIEMIDPKKVKLQLINDGVILDEKICKGKIINGLFIFRKQRQGLGLPPLLWVYRDQATAIGMTYTGDLIVATDNSGALLLGFFPLFGPPSGPSWDPEIFKRKIL